MTGFRNFLLILIISIIVFPVLEVHYHFIKENPLLGYFKLAKTPAEIKFTSGSWFKSSFQEEIQESIEGHVGFKNTFIRINNQFDFSIYGITSIPRFIKGSNKILFENEYIYEYTGKYFIGKTPFNRKVSQLKEIIPILKSMNIDLIPVLLPRKASFFPLNIPEHFQVHKRGQTNYDYLCKRLDQCHVPFIDLNHYFLIAKDTCRFPLYPKFGMHWSKYGMITAMDTLMRYIENIRHEPPSKIKIQKVTMFDSVPIEDNDIGILLNLMFSLKKAPTAYPQYTFESQNGQRKLRVLVISDSYYDLVQQTIAPDLFAENEYWYYNLSLKKGLKGETENKIVDKSDLLNKLKYFDVILLMASEVNLHRGFYRFIEETYALLFPKIHENPVLRYEDYVRNSREWFEMVVAKAYRTGQTVQQVTTEEARYQFFVDYPKLKNKTSEDTIEYIACNLRYSPISLLSIKEKAKRVNIPLEQMIHMDAKYVYNQSKRK